VLFDKKITLYIIYQLPALYIICFLVLKNNQINLVLFDKNVLIHFPIVHCIIHQYLIRYYIGIAQVFDAF